MNYATAKWFFIVGTASSLVLFLALTADTHRQLAALTHADQIDPEVIEGKKTFERHNCNDCHTILGFGGYYAPDLTRVYWRLGEEGIRERVLHPETAFANSIRKMPQQRLTEDEARDLVRFFQWVSGIQNHDWPPQDRDKRPSSETRRLVMDTGMSEGAALFKTKGCIGCHQLGRVGGTAGPELDHVGAGFDRETIKQLTLDPKSVNAAATMPKLGLSEAEADALADFLAKQR